jgi:hypothetical protein
MIPFPFLSFGRLCTSTHKSNSIPSSNGFQKEVEDNIFKAKRSAGPVGRSLFLFSLRRGRGGPTRSPLCTGT